MPYPTDPSKYSTQFQQLARLMKEGIAEIPLYDVMNAKKLRHDWYGFVRAHPKHIRHLEDRIYRTRHPSPNNPDVGVASHVQELRYQCEKLEARYEAIRSYEVTVDGSTVTFINKNTDPRLANVAAQIRNLQAQHGIDADSPHDPFAPMLGAEELSPAYQRIVDKVKRGERIEPNGTEQPKFGDDFFLQLPSETGDYEPNMDVLTDHGRENEAAKPLEEVKRSGIALDDMLAPSDEQNDTQGDPDDNCEPHEGNSG